MENNSESKTSGSPDPGAKVSGIRRLLPRVLQVVLAIAVLVGSAGVARYMMKNRPAPKRKRRQPHATMVQVIQVQPNRERVLIKATGTVRAAQQVTLHPQVKGEVRSISSEFLPGGVFKRGDVLLAIDSLDYRIALRQASAVLAQARASLKIEEGRQAIAQREYRLLGKSASGASTDLVLRKPQLRAAKANVESAAATYRKAALNLKRTTLRAPFNAVIQTRDVNIGTRVVESTRLAKLVGTDAYWVELVVPVDQLRWIRFPATTAQPGTKVRVYDSTGGQSPKYRVGRVRRLAPDLEEQGRMARLIVRVEDPLTLTPANTGKLRLLIGSYVKAEIVGNPLSSVFALPRRALRGANQVWLLGTKSRLEIRTVTVAHRGVDRVLVSGGLKAGDRLVLTDLTTPVQGMRLRVLRTSGRPQGAPKGAMNRAKSPAKKRTRRRP